MASSPSDRLVLRISLLGLAALFGYYLIYIFIRTNHGHDGDFPTFYDAARAVRQHADPYVPTPGGMYYVYPPLFAVLCVPLTHLPITAAEKVFVLVNVSAALASLLIGAKENLRRVSAQVAAPGICAIALLAGLMAENDLRGELQQMETDVLMLLMFTLALHFLDRHPWRSGAALGFALNIKYLSVLALPYLLLRRRWQAAAATVGWTIGFGLLPALVLGWRENLRCLGVALGGLLGWIGHHSDTAHAAPRANVHGISDGLSISITSAFARQFELRHLPQSYALLTAALFGLLLLTIAWALYQRHGLPMFLWPSAPAQSAPPYRSLIALEWCALIVVALAFSPDTNTRHLSMIALVYTTAATLLLVPRPGVPRGPLLCGCIIAVVGLILPIPKMFSYAFVREYFRWSVCSWAILCMYALLLWTGLCAIHSPHATSISPPLPGLADR